MNDLGNGVFLVPEISYKYEDGVMIIRNSDTKEALKMIDKVKNDLKEGIEVFCGVNDTESDVINKDMEVTEIDIRLMQDILDNINIALVNKAYLKDDSILPMLTISGSKLCFEIAERNFKREDIQDCILRR